MGDNFERMRNELRYYEQPIGDYWSLNTTAIVFYAIDTALLGFILIKLQPPQ